MLVALYLALCLLVGLCGRKRRTGFGGTFVLSLLMTPPLMLLILWFTARKRTIDGDPGTAPAGGIFHRRTAPESCACGHRGTS